MSGEFRPEQNSTVEATNDEALAKQHGLNYFDEELGQYVKRDVTAEGDNPDPAREAQEREYVGIDRPQDETHEQHEANAGTPVTIAGDEADETGDGDDALASDGDDALASDEDDEAADEDDESDDAREDDDQAPAPGFGGLQR